MEERGFRSALFGGFHRGDVLRFIEQTDRTYHEQTEGLRAQHAKLQAENDALRTSKDALARQNTDLLAQLGEMTRDTEKIRGQLDQIEQSFTRQSEEIEAVSQRAQALAEENDRLTEENCKLSEKCGEYDASKEKIAEMELSAYRRAKQIEEQAKRDLDRLRQQAFDMIAQVRRRLDLTKEHYRTALERNRQESDELARRAGEVIGDIDRIAASLTPGESLSTDHAVLEEQQKTQKQLQQVLEGLRSQHEEEA